MKRINKPTSPPNEDLVAAVNDLDLVGAVTDMRERCTQLAGIVATQREQLFIGAGCDTDELARVVTGLTHVRLVLDMLGGELGRVASAAE